MKGLPLGRGGAGDLLKAPGEIIHIGKSAFLGDLGDGVLAGTEQILCVHNADLVHILDGRGVVDPGEPPGEIHSAPRLCGRRSQYAPRTSGR